MVTRYIHAVRALAFAYILRTFRDKVALFFILLFPIMFLLIFGSLNRGNGDVTFSVALLDNSSTEFGEQFVQQLRENDILEISEELTSLEEAREAMGRGELDSIVEVPETFGALNAQNIPSGNLVVYYEEASPQSGRTLAGIMEGVFQEINRELTGTNPPLQVEQRPSSTANLSSFDYIFAGLIGFSLLSLGIFGMANSFPAEKKTGAFRRLRVAPIGPSQLIFANLITYLISGMMSIAAMVITALLVFDFNMRGDYISFTLFSAFGIIMMFGFGLAIGGWAKNENQSAPLTNIVALPLMFLSGVFFPRFLMPEWLQTITTYLPLSPIVDGLRAITAEGATIFEVGPELLLMGVWTVAIYVLAIKLFRWE